MAKTKRKQARKYLPGIVAWVDSVKASGRKPTIVEIARHFGFDNLKAFCLWLASAVSRLESATKPDGKPNEMHGTPDHVFAVALLESLKAKYEGEHPDYFVISGSGNVNANIVNTIAKRDGFDPLDPEAVKSNLIDSIGFEDETEDEDETEKGSK